MNRPFKILLLVLLNGLVCQAQQEDISAFIPDGYVLFEKYSGDLNHDAQDDCVLMIKKVDTTHIVTNRFDKKVDRNRRGIIILFQEAGTYQLADKNYNCFSSENEDGGFYYPPQLGIEIKNSELHIQYEYGRYGGWDYRFGFQNANFELIAYGASSNHGPVTNREISIDFLTKKKLVQENTYEDAVGSDEVFKTTQTNIEIEKLIQLSEIKDFDELDMAIY